MKVKQYWPFLQVSYPIWYIFCLLESPHFRINVSREIAFLCSSSVWSSYWILLPLLHKLLQWKIWLDKEILYTIKMLKLWNGGAGRLWISVLGDIWNTIAQGPEQPHLNWSWCKKGLDGVQRSLATYSMVPWFFKDCIFKNSLKPKMYKHYMFIHIQTSIWTLSELWNESTEVI